MEINYPIHLDKELFKPCGLNLPEGTTFEQWEKVGKGLQAIDLRMKWWIGDWLMFGERKYGEMYSQALEVTDYHYDTLRRCKYVSEQINIGRRRPVLSWSHHQEIAKLEPQEQDRFLDIAERGGLSSKELRARIRCDHSIDISKTKPLEGTYSTIVIDPPWDMEKIEREVRPNQVGFDYPTMSQEELYELPIKNISAENSMIFLWTTQKFLPRAFELLDHWEFKYIFTMVWHKPGGFQPVKLPQYNCEFVLFGRKGGIDFLDTKAFPTCFNGKRREHSRKPEEFYELILRVSPNPRIDIFSRQKRDGFIGWGNQDNLFSLKKSEV